MKILIKGNPYPRTINYYKKFADITDREEDADIIVSYNFTPVKTDKKIIVATNSTGLDHLDCPNARIISLRDFDLSKFTAVAELCICMAGCLMRIYRREELKNKILGIIGYGRIGKQLKKYAQNMGMKVITIDKNKNSKFDYLLNRLLFISDVVSLHITADKENENFMDLEKFKAMKKEAVFLNSARPWLVDNAALLWALNHKLAAAWFDFNMPFSHSKLFITPHLGGTTKESTLKSELLIAKKIKKLTGEVL